MSNKSVSASYSLPKLYTLCLKDHLFSPTLPTFYRQEIWSLDKKLISPRQQHRELGLEFGQISLNPSVLEWQYHARQKQWCSQHEYSITHFIYFFSSSLLLDVFLAVGYLPIISASANPKFLSCLSSPTLVSFLIFVHSPLLFIILTLELTILLASLKKSVGLQKTLFAFFPHMYFSVCSVWEKCLILELF